MPQNNRINRLIMDQLENQQLAMDEVYTLLQTVQDC